MKDIYRWVDRVALWDLHRVRSGRWHFHSTADHHESEPKRVAEFYRTPAMVSPVYLELGSYRGCRVGRFEYPSTVTTPYMQNNTACGLYYEHSGSNVSVILLHGWRMDGMGRITSLYLDALLERGFSVYLPMLPYHMDRGPAESGYCGEFFISADVNRTLQALQQAVGDTRALIQCLGRRNQQVLLMGVSLGGLVGSLTAAMEPQVDALVSVFSPNSLSYIVWNGVPGLYLKRDFMAHGFSYQALQRYWSILEPATFLPQVKRERILMLMGRSDQYVPYEDTAELWEAWGQPERIVYPYGHAALALKRKRLRKDTISFIDSIYR